MFNQVKCKRNNRREPFGAATSLHARSGNVLELSQPCGLFN